MSRAAIRNTLAAMAATVVAASACDGGGDDGPRAGGDKNACRTSTGARGGGGDDGPGAGGDGGTEGGCASGEAEVGGVCVRVPAQEAERTACGQITDNCADTAGRPRVDCVGQAAQPGEGPATATLTGFVDVFGNGPTPSGIVIEVFDAAALDAAAAGALAACALGAGQFPDLAPVGRATIDLGDAEDAQAIEVGGMPCRACPRDEDLRLPCDLPTADCAPACDPVLDYCYQGTCRERLRWECRYRIDGVPTDTHLAVRTSGEGGFEDASWARLVQYRVWIPADEVAADGTFEQEVNILHLADYRTIPTTVIGSPLPLGRGAIAGQTHDCDDVRVQGAQVGFDPAPRQVSYFNGNPVDTLPLAARLSLGTHQDGLYAALDLSPGAVRVVAVARVAGEVVPLGDAAVTVFPDTVTVLGFEGVGPPE